MIEKAKKIEKDIVQSIAGLIVNIESFFKKKEEQNENTTNTTLP